jgi:hypothetical protein
VAFQRRQVVGNSFRLSFRSKSFKDLASAVHGQADGRFAVCADPQETELGNRTENNCLPG